MRLNVKYIDNYIEFGNGFVNCLEIENKNYFYKIVNDLNCVANGEIIDEILFTDNDYKEISLTNKIDIVFDYFNFDFNSKKIILLLNKKVNENLSIDKRDSLSKLYEKIKKIYTPIINEFDMNLSLNSDFDLDILIKLLNISINKKDNILDNLLLLIDIEKELCLNKLLIFVNLKQYLSKSELVELYKYLLYNNIDVLLIDSQAYGVNNEYEKKLIIDEELEEYLIV